jgi:hypothetical protein
MPNYEARYSLIDRNDVGHVPVVLDHVHRHVFRPMSPVTLALDDEDHPATSRMERVAQPEAFGFVRDLGGRCSL